MWLAIATLLVLLHESSFAQGLFGGFNPPASYQYFRPPSQHSAPPARPKWRAPSQQVSVPIPRPENTTIDEKYAKGSIVNHERYLYFVDEPGHAVRYPVAVGTPVDQWEGIQTITAKRENPRWFPSEDIQWEMGVPPMVPPGPQNPLGPRALYLGDTLYRIHGTKGPAQSAGPSRMDVFECTILISSSFTKKYK
jgi:lipoprotein-anchoring transpeptidase ErfK/SrfK